MLFPFVENSFQWKGTNFPELYEWLTGHTFTKKFKLKVLKPGQPNSSIEIIIDNIKLALNIYDWIVKDNDTYYVVKDEK